MAEPTRVDTLDDLLFIPKDGYKTVQHWSWVTDVRVRPCPVSRLRRGGRARGKIAHATCHTRNHPGNPCEPHSGHGTPHLSVVCALVMRLAFRVDRPRSLAAPCSKRCGRRGEASAAGGSAGARCATTTASRPCEHGVQP